ncbi:Major facilitator superfamily domain general substrate transporter [Penicillium vulpinum]|uniref:Major facilitator superfamily domain general substrate transporter n=1 Tax=Penicillium vulpinum TaxID=29845 RepID=UPI0025477465|nr:Major facilitator superfamily domain general substrate transporter [Penicillium vulpinum]KAJ5950314.1 Major facilitator superfamily domain general substrate transporter [Penicillium vulpinum]
MGYIQEICGLASEDYILSLSTSLDQGPFKSEDDFNKVFVDTYQKIGPKRHIGSFLDGMLPGSHCILFAYGDLRPQNIMIKGGNVAAIID